MATLLFSSALGNEPDTRVLERLTVIERGSLAAVAAILALNAVAWAIPGVARLLPGRGELMSLGGGLAGFLSLASLYTYNSSARLRTLSRMLALALLIGYGGVTAVDLAYGNVGYDSAVAGNVSGILSGIAPQTAACFALLGLVILLTPARRGLTTILADISLLCLFGLVLTVLSAHIIGSFAFFDSLAPLRTSLQLLFCLLLLMLVAFCRRAEFGFFSIFLGSGIGSRIVRLICPPFIVIPFLREAARAHIINTHRMPPHYITAVLATTASVLIVVICMYMGWRFNAMEAEIQDLSLRDPLTGLYNLRGFRLLAEQALLFSQRSAQPFSVLFVDVDDLKRTNDLLGHQAGSELLVETAQILKETFRESDVVGRIGGDEFAVAGQFTRASIEHAAQRLKDALAHRNTDPERIAPLRFSVGHVTAEAGRRDSLNALLAEADEAMYQEKRRRKIMAV